jgi:peptidyl-prolyl cis-trans isomerase C
MPLRHGVEGQHRCVRGIGSALRRALGDSSFGPGGGGKSKDQTPVFLPERRTARHILITVNDDYAENTRDAALARLEAIAGTLRGDDADGLIERFAGAARRHSECPSALEDGRLGTVSRGQLYPALDAALFQLGAGQLSGILESPVGLHLLLCEKIHPALALPFSQARPRIREALEQRRRRDTQRTWLKALQGHEVGSRVLHPPLSERCE